MFDTWTTLIIPERFRDEVLSEDIIHLQCMFTFNLNLVGTGIYIYPWIHPTAKQSHQETTVKLSDEFVDITGFIPGTEA